MKIRNLVGIFLMLGLISSCSSGEVIKENLSVHYATKAEAATLITGDDDFSRNLNQFDLNVRLQKQEATKEEWEILVKGETMEWTEEEIEKMKMAFDSIQSNIEEMNLDIPYPKEIILLKTTMKEELGAGAYTRKNWIAIGANELKMATQAQLTQLVGHELFHVLSRHDADFKQKVYHVFGFKSADHEIVLPEDAVAKRISNPDMAMRDSYIPLTVEGKVQNCVEFIYADHAYDGGNIFDCLKVGFIPLDEHLQPVVADSGTVIYPIHQVMEEFQKKIGNNTTYIIDPEEISAEHFSFLVTYRKDLPNPEYIETMKNVLKRKLK